MNITLLKRSQTYRIKYVNLDRFSQKTNCKVYDGANTLEHSVGEVASLLIDFIKAGQIYS